MKSDNDSETELIVLSAADEQALLAQLDKLIAFVERTPDVPLLDVAYTASLMRGKAQLALVVKSVEDLRNRLILARSRILTGADKIRDRTGTYYCRRKLLSEDFSRMAFVYPGVMSFYPDMMRDLSMRCPECRGAFEELEEAMSGEVGFSPSNFIFPPADYYRHDADVFSSGAYAQALVATFAACSAMTRFLKLVGVEPHGIVGCAGGDLASIMRAGAIGDGPLARGQRVKAIADIYRIVDMAVRHGGFPKATMVTLLERREGEIDKVVASFPEGVATLAIDLSPHVKTYAIVPEARERVLAAFAAADVRSTVLDFDIPFYTPKCEGMMPAIRKFADEWILREPSCAVYSTSTTELMSPKPRLARKEMAERWSRSIRFTETIRHMYDDGYRVFLEVGPRGLMTSAIGDILDGKEFAAIAMDSIHRRGMLQMQLALAQLIACGAKVEVSALYCQRGARELDFSSVVPYERTGEAEMRLSRNFPRLMLLGDDEIVSFSDGIAARGERAAARREAQEREQRRRSRRFGFGTMNPLLGDAEAIENCPPGVTELKKTLRIKEMPFLSDFAFGASQLSYSDPNLRGLVVLSLVVGVELVAEAALLAMPAGRLVAVEDFNCRRMVSFADGALTLFVRTERIASSQAGVAAFKVQLRNDAEGSEYAWPVMEAVVLLALNDQPRQSAKIKPLLSPRAVHWSGREIYPAKLCYGKRLRGISFVENWSEDGLDYEVEMPPAAGSLVFSRFPDWAVDPLLLQMVVSGFSLWRSHEKFVGAFSFPFRMRRLALKGVLPQEGAKLKCYLRLDGVTPRSQLSNIYVTLGNGNALIEISGWEELTLRVPEALCKLVLQPAVSFITEPATAGILGDPAMEFSSAFITEVPYALFERNEELWLKIVANVILGDLERHEFADMKANFSRRTEWLFGRLVAKEAVRRFLKDYCQARWSYADVQIWANDSGKPMALGKWQDDLRVKLDVAIAHTEEFIIAVAAANARVGVDVEAFNRNLTDEFLRGAFTDDERDLAAAAVHPAQTMLRFWCAKEALSKALGTGIRFSPKEMMVTGWNADTGALSLRLEGGWLTGFEALRGRELPISTRIMNGHFVATAFLPVSFFPDDEEYR